jgi:pimeloyl-ACP methyl ester carboxylesterase
MPAVRVNEGVSLHYEERGSGPVIVWIPGTGNSGRVWERYQLPDFVDRYTCITVDNRGTGSSDSPEGPYTVELMARDIEDLVRQLELQGAHFVGFSLGSVIIQELAIRAPELVGSAVLLSTWSSTDREEHIRRHYQARLLALEHAPREVFAAFAFWMWAPSFVDDEPERMAELEKFFVSVSRSQPKHAYAKHFEADLSHDALDRLDQIHCPTLVVYGTEDLITLPRYNRRVADRIPGARIAEIPNAGHIAWGERPDRVNLAINEFLDSLDLSQRVPAKNSSIS